MLATPLLVEVMGAGFTKEPRSQVCAFLRSLLFHCLTNISSTTLFVSLVFKRYIVHPNGPGLPVFRFVNFRILHAQPSVEIVLERLKMIGSREFGVRFPAPEREHQKDRRTEKSCGSEGWNSQMD